MNTSSNDMILFAVGLISLGAVLILIPWVICQNNQVDRLTSIIEDLCLGEDEDDDDDDPEMRSLIPVTPVERHLR